MLSPAFGSVADNLVARHQPSDAWPFQDRVLVHLPYLATMDWSLLDKYSGKIVLMEVG